MKRLSLAPILALAAIVGASAQSADPAWTDQLTEQMAREHQCAVELFINLKEGELAGRKTFEARVQCADGRQFDAARTEPETEFVVSLCEQTAVC